MRGYFQIGIYHVKNSINVGGLFRSAHCFGASSIFTIGRRYQKQSSDTSKAWRSIPLYHYLSFDDFYRQLPRECKLVGVEITDKAKDITSYIHPEQCAYCLGAEDYGLPEQVLERCWNVIKIPTTNCLNVAVTGSVVMYDRYLKGQKI